MDLSNMKDTHVSLTAVGAAVLWALGVALVVVELVSAFGTGHLGVVLVAGAATLTVRGYFVDLEDRERNAFRIGQDSMRDPSRRQR